MTSVVYKRLLMHRNEDVQMTAIVGRHTTLIVNFLFKILIFQGVGKKYNHSLVSDAEREIPTLRSMDNARNWVNLVLASSVYPQVGISLSALETDDRFYFPLLNKPRI